MSLDALAPDQRAVVQLILQQGRSYDDLAGLLGIGEDAVRDRARRGLAALADPGDLDVTEQGEVADFLLGQGSPSAREATRSLLRTDRSHHEWAAALAAELGDLPGAHLPDVPELARRRRPAATETPVEPGVPADAAAAGADPTVPGIAPPEDLGTAGSGITTPDVDEEPAVRARPRPARATRPAPAVPDLSDESDAAVSAPRSSRLGGALLIAVVALVVVVGAIVVLTGGDDADTESASSGATPTAVASGTPGAEATPIAVGDERLQPVNTLPLTGLPGSDAQGQIAFYLDQQNEDANQQTITFFAQANGLNPREAYAIWLVGGGDPYRVGYASNGNGQQDVISSDGVLSIRGPAVQAGTSRRARATQRDARRFTTRLQSARQIVVSRETDANARQPGEIVLSVDLSQGQGGGQATATPTP